MLTFVAFISAMIFAFSIVCLFARIVPPFMGAIVVRLGTPVRSIGPGLHFVLWPIESISEPTSLREKVIDDKMMTETRGDFDGDSGEEVVPLDFSIEYAPIQEWLIAFLTYTSSHLEDAIKQRIKSLLSIAVRKRKNRDEVYDSLKMITQEVQDEFFQNFSTQYGVRIRFMIDDPELPKELAEAEVKREIQKKENERRKLDVVAMADLAKHLVELSKPNEDAEPTLTFEKGIEKAQVQLKIVPETRTTYDLGDNAVQAFGGASGVFWGILNKIFSKSKSKPKSKPKKN
ncbi:MAG: hypothetical protein A3I24_03230 [Candidatus Harrisonbacteria bacterium RIFCSPLOWO2_02_FULL_41_13b]|uniref:Band 7 domain-containing protein n=1 Tax=Candidatus Harrisonbacteria bacterium RIFCSPLOWO2_02_FULL_41_13b TaxID=1798409 RepID=A0A1G1ZTU9_9BACT|nr:MAG: hypothetical protein A3J53_01425 [Candidatus Harrisonbacteria bacterium RIFCSPHIGHO2_02_FULL_40_20]OGY67982.1 MAG: hypothetical protein A3I24_03230 [Candidatus Harrisonbacteria bacterium RIFCSPLOWO2_02_FULL_41_13b]